MSTSLINLLPFDSDILRTSVASIDVDPRWGVAELDRAIAKAKSSNIGLLYLFVPPASTIRLSEIPNSFHSVRVDWAKRLHPPATKPAPADGPVVIGPVRIKPGEEVPVELIALARAGGHRSRFRLDRRIANQSFERLYRIWIERSLSGEIADVVLVAGDDDGAVGLITVGSPAPDQARIGLLAVSERRRGQGLGRRLLSAAEQYAAASGRRELLVATQADNKGAAALYRGHGFSPVSSTHISHVWLDPAIDDTLTNGHADSVLSTRSDAADVRG